MTLTLASLVIEDRWRGYLWPVFPIKPLSTFKRRTVQGTIDQVRPICDIYFLFFQFEKFFENSGLILFLNKKDQFEEKILQPNNRLLEHFPDYDGPARDPESAKTYFLSRFTELLPAKRQESFYSHFTCATDTENIKNIFKVVRQKILEGHLQEIGLKYWRELMHRGLFNKNNMTDSRWPNECDWKIWTWPKTDNDKNSLDELDRNLK